MLRTTVTPLVLAVAVLVLAACGGQAPAETTTEISVTGTDTMAFEPDAFTVPAGEQITVELTSEPGAEHDFVIEENGEVEVVHADAGATATGTFSIDEPGTYTVYCAIPGHREAGMEATLTVVGE